MTKEEEDLLARSINEEAERVKARDKRHAEFWDGLRDLDTGIQLGRLTPQERIRQVMDEGVAAFDAGIVPPMHPCWKSIRYIGSFDMTYNYTGSIERDPDQETGRTYYAICGNWDSLDEVSLTELLRKELTHFLTAAGSLAKRTGSSTYEGWIQLIMDINFEHRSSFWVFSKDYSFEAFYEKIEALTHRLWADNAIAQHTPTTRK